MATQSVFPHWLFALLATAGALFFRLETAPAWVARGESAVSDTTRARLLLVEYDTLLFWGRYREAGDAAAAAAAIYIRELGSESAQAAWAISRQGNAMIPYGELEWADSLLHKALAVQQKYSRQPALELAYTYTSLANLSMQRQLLPQADKFFEQTLSILEALPDTEGVALRYQVEMLTGLRFVFAGQPIKARPFLEKSLYHFGDQPFFRFYKTMTYGILSLAASQEENYRNAIDLANRGLAWSEREHPLAIACFNALGIAFAESGDSPNALRNFEASIALANRFWSVNSPVRRRLRVNLGTAYMRQGENQKVLDLFQQILDEAREAKSFLLTTDIGNLHTSRGLVYHSLEQYDAAISEHSLARDAYLGAIITGSGDTLVAAASFSNLGEAFLARGKGKVDFDSAASLFKKSLLWYGNSPARHYPLRNLGRMYLRANQLSEAKTYLEQALAMQQKLFWGEHPLIAQSCLDLGDLALGDNRPNDSRRYYEDALKAIGYENATDVQYLKSPYMAWQAQTSLGRWWRLRFERERQTGHLLSALQHLEQSDSLMAIIRERVIGLEEFQQGYDQERRRYFEEALTTVHHLIRFDPANRQRWQTLLWRYLEQSKALLALNSMRDVVRFSGVPDSLLGHYNNVRREVGRLEFNKAEFYLRGVGDIYKIIIRFEQKKSAMDSLRRQILYANSDAKFLFDIEVDPLDSIRAALQPGETMLNYFAGHDSLLVIILTKSDLKIKSLPRDFLLDSWVDDLRQGLYGYFIPGKRESFGQYRDKYLARATGLYTKLFAPLLPLLRDSNVVIIPDGAIGYIPFAALLLKKPGNAALYKSYPYLGNKYLFSYCPSATLFRTMRGLKRPAGAPKGDVLALAPFWPVSTDSATTRTDASMRADMKPLPASERELDSIARYFPLGMYRFYPEAGKKVFIEHAPLYRILHLSTHAKMEDRPELSGINFLNEKGEPDRLYINELYGLPQLRAELVTLSACETGTGRLLNGEGVISLARAFSALGARSVAATFWSVNSGQTAALMASFYKNLAAGLPKSAALGLAQRTHLLTVSNEEYAYPYYWAGAFLFGDTAPLLRE